MEESNIKQGESESLREVADVLVLPRPTERLQIGAGFSRKI